MDNPLIARDDIKEFSASLKEIGKKIVTCNGCFDIIHQGHVYFLSEAKKQGDILIVGLNSDSYIKKAKGPNRPVNDQESRAIVLSALKPVDYVVIFEEPDPIQLIKDIRPDVHCNGIEYGPDCVESAAVKEVGAILHLIEKVEGYSTTETIKKAGNS